MVDLDNMELERVVLRRAPGLQHESYLRARGGADREREQLRRLLVAIKLELRKRRRMSLDWLADAPLPAVKLHGTLDLERRRIRRVARDTNEDEPLFITTCPVVDDLRANECGMTVEDLLRG